MRSITILPTTFIMSAFIALLLFIAPTPAKAVTVDDLLTQVQSMMEQMAKMQVQLLELQKAGGVSSVVSTPTTSSVPTGAVLGAKTFKFTQDTIYGATNDDVKRIQTLLKLDKTIYPEGVTSGFFGPATQRAIQNLQKKFGLDPVGVVGPATTALLERLISQQNSDGTYPADILDPTRPTGSVLGVTTSTVTQNPLVQQLLDQVAKLQSQKSSGSNTADTSKSTNLNIDKISVSIDDGESSVKVFYKDGNIKNFWVAEDEKDNIVEAIAEQLKISASDVEDLAGFGKIANSSSDTAEEISAEVDIEGEETDVDVVYENGDEDSFTVDESDYDNIIEAIADELDMDEDDVKDIIEFDWNIDAEDIKDIKVSVENDEADVSVRLDSGDKIKLVIEESKESKIVKEIAHILDIDDSDVEDLLDIEFND